MATTWRKIIVSGSNAELNEIFASGKISGSAELFASLSLSDNGSYKTVIYDTATGKFYFTGSYAGGGGGGGGIFVDQGTYYNTGNTIEITGSAAGSALRGAPSGDKTRTQVPSAVNSRYALLVSESAYFTNHNVGHPNSFQWQTGLAGSIFNNYNATTDVSEIIRALVGIVSASNPSFVAAPQPRASKWASSTVEGETVPSTDATTTWNTVFVPSTLIGPSLIAPIRYLQTKGFNSGAGKKLFDLVGTVYQTTNNDYGIRINSNSSLGTTYFDAGIASAGVRVFAIATQSFSDTQSVATPVASSTFSTRSLVVVTSTIDTGVLRVKNIASGTPAVIPPSYQEAYYTGLPIITARKYHPTKADFGSVAITAAAISSSGYYRYHGIKAGFASSSAATIGQVIGRSLSLATLSDQPTYFITPLTTSDVTSIQSQTVAFDRGDGAFDFTAVTATSRSLSGAPYLNNAGWLNTKQFWYKGLFRPLYYAVASSVSTLAEVSASSTIVNLTASGDWQWKLSNGLIVAGSPAVYMSGGSNTTAPSIGAAPYQVSTASLGSGILIGIGPLNNNRTSYTGATNVVEQYPLTTTWTYQPRHRTWNSLGTWTPQGTAVNINFHTPGTFRQPASSGSLAVWISSNGQTGFTGEATGSTRFLDETRRKPIYNLTVANATGGTWNSGSRLRLGDNGDLQYKPGTTNGFLVNPQHGANSTGVNTNGGYGYWYPTGSYSSGHYKWALHEFDYKLAEGAFKSSITLTINNGNNNLEDFVAWDSTTNNSYAVGIIFSYQFNNLNEGGVDNGSKPRIFDVFSTNAFDPTLPNVAANTAGQNPFNESVEVVREWPSRSVSAGSITLGLQTLKGQRIVNLSNGPDYSKIWVLVRYKGAPSNTLRGIAVR